MPAKTSAAAILVSPLSKNASQTRIYTWMKGNGQETQYFEILLNALGLLKRPLSSSMINYSSGGSSGGLPASGLPTPVEL